MSAPTLKDVANDALISLIQSASDAMTLLKGEIPIAVRELLTYYTAIYITSTVTLALIVGVAIWYLRRYFKKDEYTSDGEDIFATLCGIGGFVCALFLVMECVPNLLKIILAPRIWLIEYAAGLVK